MTTGKKPEKKPYKKPAKPNKRKRKNLTRVDNGLDGSKPGRRIDWVSK